MTPETEPTLNQTAAFEAVLLLLEAHSGLEVDQVLMEMEHYHYNGTVMTSHEGSWEEWTRAVKSALAGSRSSVCVDLHRPPGATSSG